MIKSNIKKTLNISNLSIQSLFLKLGVLGFVGMWACKTNDPLATPMPNTDYSIIDGDTVKTVVFKDYKKLKDFDPNGKNFIVVGDTIVTYKEPKLHTPPAKDPDLSKLKNNDDPELKGKPLRMVAIGGSLTAGVRDGGYFNEGILTSYPNLIARQMKLKKFEQPLFDPSDFNGFGRKVPTSFNPTGGPVPKFNEVKNNSGVESIVETTGAFDKNKVQNVSLKKYKSYQTLDNWAVPNLSVSTLLPSGKISGTDFYKDNKSFKASLERVAQDYDKSFSNHVFRNKFDFFIYEVGWEDILGVIFDKNNTYNMLGKQSILPSKNPEEIFKIYNSDEWYYDPAINGEIKFLKQVANNKVKYACFLNLPPLDQLPYFKIINQDKQQELLSTVQNSFFYFTNGLGTEVTGISLLPTSEVDSLYSKKVHIALKKGIDSKRPLSLSSAVYGSTVTEAKTLIKSFNTQTAAFSKIFNAPLVDMYGLYEKIYSGNYTTDDGVRVDGSYPNGNFFSSDGIYPTAFGQAIIANEAIKAINAHYKTEIPLIPTREYLNIK